MDNSQVMEGDYQKVQFDYDHVWKTTPRTSSSLASRKVENYLFKPFHTQTPKNTQEFSPHVQKNSDAWVMSRCCGALGQSLDNQNVPQ